MTEAPPTPGDNRSAKDVFLEALDLETGDRPAFIASECAENPEQLAEVQRLLGAYEGAEGSGFLGAAQDSEVQSGAWLGPYELGDLIGEGGFGRVFVAQQTTPIQRQVAIKVLKPGMDSGQVLARFEAERHALARMDHPGIARILDAGTTPSGRPFFVMEHVRGEPITSYCDRNKLSVPERVELFEQVCFAVHHAHTKGVLHRDLKPSNLLVTEVEGRPQPKVIDFGIAKALASPLTERTLRTADQQLLGTPQYMSPEQARLDSEDVDTRSDIYSLGALLYELLTGSTPLTGEALQQAHGNLQQVLAGFRVERPSQRVRRELDWDIANDRGCMPAELFRLLRGDLDWITLMALEQDRHRRYDAAAALARDVRRHLEDRPVLARRPATGYLLAKFIKRHRVTAVAGAAVGIALITGLVLATLGQREAARQRDRAESQLRDLHLAQARATRLGSQPGKRIASLASIEAAAEIRRDIDLRDEAFACLGVEDLVPGLRFPGLPNPVADDPAGHGMLAFWIPGEGLQIRHVLHWDSADKKSADLETRCVIGDLSARPWRTEFSPDGSTVAIALPGNRVQIHSAEDGRMLWQPETGQYQHAGIAFDPVHSPPEWVALASPDGWLQRYAVADGTPLDRFAAPGDPERLAMAASPNGRLLAVADGGEASAVMIHDLAFGPTATPLMIGAPAAIHDFAWHPDGDLLAGAAHDNQIHVWSTREGREVMTLRGHQGSVRRVVFDAAGRYLASQAWDNSVRIWRVRDGELLTAPLVQHWLVGFGDQLITWNTQGLHVWRAASPVELKRGTAGGHFSGPGKVNWSNGGQWISTGGANGTTLWDGQSLKPLLQVSGEPSRGAVFLQEDGVLVVATEEGLDRWELHPTPGGVTAMGPTPIFREGYVNGVCAVPGTAEVYATCRSGLVQVDVDEGHVLRRFPAHAGMTTPPSVSPDGRYVFAGSWHGDPGRMLEVASGEVVLSIPGVHVRGRFSADGERFCVGVGETHRVFTVGSWQEVRSFRRAHPDEMAGALGFGTDALLALATSRYQIQLVDSVSGEVFATVETPDGIATTDLAFAPDGQRLALLSPTEHLLCWNLAAVRAQLRSLDLDWVRAAPGDR